MNKNKLNQESDARPLKLNFEVPKEFSDFMTEFAANVNKQNQFLNKILIDASKEISKALYSKIPIDLINEAADRVFKPLNESLDRLREYLENLPEHFKIAAQHGWYPHIMADLHIAPSFADAIKSNHFDYADKIMMNYYSSNADRIFETLIRRHPKRKQILEDVYKAFSEKNYYLMIPTALAQVDGICHDYTKKKFFIKIKDPKSKYRYFSEVLNELDIQSDSFFEVYLAPMLQNTPIMAYESDVDNFQSKLNRHKVLHGVSTDYGTQINALKTISLMIYVSDILTELSKKEKERR
jgi:hypothetical protein